MPTPLQILQIDDSVESVRFFNGRLLSASDLTREQQAGQARLERLARAIGVGVADGLEVEKTSDARVRIRAGLGFTAAGAVVALERDVEADLARPLDESLRALGDGRFHDAIGARLALIATGLFALALIPDSRDEGRAPAALAGRGAARVGVDHARQIATLALVPLPPLPEPLASLVPASGADPGGHAALRNGLAAALISGEHAPWPDLDRAMLPLALVCGSADAILWLDMYALRRPLAPAGVAPAHQRGLARQAQLRGHVAEIASRQAADSEPQLSALMWLPASASLCLGETSLRALLGPLAQGRAELPPLPLIPIDEGGLAARTHAALSEPPLCRTGGRPALELLRCGDRVGWARATGATLEVVLAGEDVDDGALANTRVCLRASGGLTWSQEAHPSWPRGFRFTGLPAGQLLTLSVENLALAPVAPQVIDAVYHGVTIDIIVSISPGRGAVIVQLTDQETGRSIERAALTLSDGPALAWSASERAFVATDLSLGERTLRIEAPHYMPLERPLSLLDRTPLRLSLGLEPAPVDEPDRCVVWRLASRNPFFSPRLCIVPELGHITSHGQRRPLPVDDPEATRFFRVNRSASARREQQAHRRTRDDHVQRLPDLALFESLPVRAPAVRGWLLAWRAYVADSLGDRATAERVRGAEPEILVSRDHDLDDLLSADRGAQRVLASVRLGPWSAPLRLVHAQISTRRPVLLGPWLPDLSEAERDRLQLFGVRHLDELLSLPLDELSLHFPEEGYRCAVRARAASQAAKARTGGGWVDGLLPEEAERVSELSGNPTLLANIHLDELAKKVGALRAARLVAAARDALPREAWSLHDVGHTPAELTRLCDLGIRSKGDYARASRTSVERPGGGTWSLLESAGIPAAVSRAVSSSAARTLAEHLGAADIEMSLELTHIGLIGAEAGVEHTEESDGTSASLGSLKLAIPIDEGGESELRKRIVSGFKAGFRR